MKHELRERLERTLVSLASTQPRLLKDYLPPRLWEPLRRSLQDTYRQATGEQTAVLKVEEGNP